MLVYVRNKRGEPLMPCNPGKARRLLREGEAKVVSKVPFVIKLTYGSSGYRQEIAAGIDIGSRKIGVAARADNRVLYLSEVEIRDNIKKRMDQRRQFRRRRNIPDL